MVLTYFPRNSLGKPQISHILYFIYESVDQQRRTVFKSQCMNINFIAGCISIIILAHIHKVDFSCQAVPSHCGVSCLIHWRRLSWNHLPVITRPHWYVFAQELKLNTWPVLASESIRRCCQSALYATAVRNHQRYENLKWWFLDFVKILRNAGETCINSSHFCLWYGILWYGCCYVPLKRKLGYQGDQNLKSTKLVIKANDPF